MPNFADIPVLVVEYLDDKIYKIKKWKRRGRLPKIKQKLIGTKPVFYRVGRELITNPKGYSLLLNASSTNPNQNR